MFRDNNTTTTTTEFKILEQKKQNAFATLFYFK